jgi:hypothetical protein
VVGWENGVVGWVVGSYSTYYPLPATRFGNFEYDPNYSPIIPIIRWGGKMGSWGGSWGRVGRGDPNYSRPNYSAGGIHSSVFRCPAGGLSCALVVMKRSFTPDHENAVDEDQTT